MDTNSQKLEQLAQLQLAFFEDHDEMTNLLYRFVKSHHQEFDLSLIE